jgi:hypothetical protein
MRFRAEDFFKDVQRTGNVIIDSKSESFLDR